MPKTEYYALLIVIGKHANNQKSLPAAVGEAEKFEKTLHQFEYTTHFLKDEQVTKSKVFDAVEQIPYPSPECENSQLIVYFSGHGCAIGNIVQQLYLATYDMKNQESIGELISFNELKMAVSLRGYTQVLFILDCCCAGLVYNAVKNNSSPQHQASSSTFEEYKLPCTLAFLATDSVRDVFDKVFTPALVHSLQLCLQSREIWSVYQVQEICSAAAREISKANPVLYSTVPRHPVVQRLNIVETGEFTFVKSQKLGRRIASPEASSALPHPSLFQIPLAGSTNGTTVSSTSMTGGQHGGQPLGSLLSTAFSALGNVGQTGNVAPHSTNNFLQSFLQSDPRQSEVIMSGRKARVERSEGLNGFKYQYYGKATDVLTNQSVEVYTKSSTGREKDLAEKFAELAKTLSQ